MVVKVFLPIGQMMAAALKVPCIPMPKMKLEHSALRLY
jgi:hypothetical protein